MKLLKWGYKKIVGKEAPYYYSYSIFTIISKPIRKFFCQVVAPNCVSNHLRIFIYRLCGFKIGRNCFIGMKCYLDDMCFDCLSIGDNCTISYGVYFSCHGKNQEHLPITIKDNAYIGMRASIISKSKLGTGVTVGNGAIIGAGTLVNRDVPDGMTAVGVPCKILEKAAF